MHISLWNSFVLDLTFLEVGVSAGIVVEEVCVVEDPSASEFVEPSIMFLAIPEGWLELDT